MESFEQLASQYQPMIRKIIRSLNIYKNIDEFYQIGLIALWDAQKNFHEEKGSFSNFAYSWIRGKMLNQLAKDKKQQERYPACGVKGNSTINRYEGLPCTGHPSMHRGINLRNVHVKKHF